MTSQLDSSYLISPPIYARATGSDDYISALAKGTYFGDMQMSGWSDLSRQPGQPEPKNTQIPTPPGTYEFSKPIEIPPSKAPSHSPVYDLYGSSVVAVNPLLTTSKFPAPLPSSTPAFDPVALGLPVPPPKVAGSKNVTGLYSSSGFDMMGVLARVASRVNPQIQIGPVDLSCSFLVVDAKKFDMPIVYASETFSKLTGYPNEEIVGRNCRFLQSPTGDVAQGERRVYTDSEAAHHMKTHIQLGRESQSSLINYRKDGSPFINLVTLIPIVWDDASIAYYVGFQVDLVDQPSAILEKMKNGTYVVNYSLINSSVMMPPQAPSFIESTEDMWIGEDAGPGDMIMETESTGKSSSVPDIIATEKILDAMGSKPEVAVGDEISRKQFNRMLLDHCDDFVHVLSLKGSLLYVSPSSSRLLEYEPSELVGIPLSSFCHPSDIVSVLRELKEAGSISQPTISLLYRIRRKDSGYMWLEASGKLHFEHGKGRKCVILVGRPREVYNMSWNALDRVGGLGSSEYWSHQYWSKLSLEGMLLYTTNDVKRILGFTPSELVGTLMAQLTVEADLPALKHALRQAAKGIPFTLRHTLRSRNGPIDVVTNFHAAVLSPLDNAKHSTIIAQTVRYSNESQRNAYERSKTRNSTGWNKSTTSSLPPSNTLQIGPSNPPRSSDPPAAGGSYKTLAHPSESSDNMFNELETTRGTSWQYELASVRLENASLRKEKERMDKMRSNKRAHDRVQQQTAASIASAAASRHQVRGCANCGRLDTSRDGPTGRDSLCDMCGTRWAKSMLAEQQRVYHPLPQQHQSSNSPYRPPMQQLPYRPPPPTSQYPYLPSGPP